MENSDNIDVLNTMKFHIELNMNIYVSLNKLFNCYKVHLYRNRLIANYLLMGVYTLSYGLFLLNLFLDPIVLLLFLTDNSKYTIN